MVHQRVSHIISHFLGVIRRVSIVTVLAVITAPGYVVAADLSADVSIDSEIQLIEETGDAAYASYAITMSTQNGSTTLTLEKDGQKSQGTMPYEESYALWHYMREMDVGNMGDAPQENLFPGQSAFKFILRNGSESHTFSAYGVDFLTDTRYRSIARAILKIGEKYNPN